MFKVTLVLLVLTDSYEIFKLVDQIVTILTRTHIHIANQVKVVLDSPQYRINMV
jgi:hypothetical protein